MEAPLSHPGKFDSGRGAVLTSRYGALGGASSLGNVAGAALGTLLFHRLGPSAPFSTGAAASVASLCVVCRRWPVPRPSSEAEEELRRGLLEEEEEEEDLPGGALARSGDRSGDPRGAWCRAAAAEVCRGATVLFAKPPSRRAAWLRRKAPSRNLSGPLPASRA